MEENEQRIITLTTDFGLDDGYVGTLKGVILGINPRVTIVDITHAIAPQQIEEGAFVLAASAPYFPPGTIHVVVVDPGVGSTRRAIAMRVGETFFVAPDNGVLSAAIAAFDSPILLQAVQLNRPTYWLPVVSRTFHGRDLFAPVAAHLSLGVPLEALGDPIDDWVRLVPHRPSRRTDGTLVARISHIDRFGNLVINIVDSVLANTDRRRVRLTIGGRTLEGIQGTYAEVQAGEVVALFGSSGYLEIAMRNGSAARLLQAQVGDEVVLDNLDKAENRC